MRWNRIYKKARSLKKRGVKKSIQSLISIIQDQWFDFKLGVHTEEKISLHKLGIKSDYLGKDKKARKYQATRAGAFRALMKHLDLPKDNVFVDLGSGKGRLLLLAMEYGFTKAIGVELSSSLCQIAQKNVETYQKTFRTHTEVEVVESNVVDYEIKEDETIYFLFNPFGKEVMETIFENIKESLQKRNREVWVIYNNPVHQDLVSSLEFLKPFCTFVHGGNIFKVYVHRVNRNEAEFRIRKNSCS